MTPERCSFCGRTSADARIVHGPGGLNLCAACVAIAADKLGEHKRRSGWWRSGREWRGRGLPEV